MKKTIIKIIALILTITFTTTTVCSSAPSVYTINVPEKNGKVTQRYKGKDERVIVHIQDAHSSSEAQENLAEIICSLLPQIQANDRSGYTHLPAGTAGIKTQIDADNQTDQSAIISGQEVQEERSEHNLRESALKGRTPFIGIEGAIGEYDLKEL